ncbi:hypothetical protein SUGI_0659310 [Cryptomeria japonica]|nr:hypothetical protein SUGI_0659310 [Cryptomeria japonica]
MNIFYALIILVCLWVHATADNQSFVQVRDGHFSIDGKEVYFSGFNAYWLLYQAADPSARRNVSEVFYEAAHNDLTVARTWAFNDGGYRALQISPGVYDEKVFKALDFVVNEAKSYGIRLVLSLVNNYKDFGGKAQYVEWANKSAGQEDDFFTNPTVKEYYRNHIKTVLTRVNSITGIAYRDDPTIFAWELINEARCETDPSGKILLGWIEEMAQYVKSIDTKHLLEIGLEGFYGDSTPQTKQTVNPKGFETGTDFILHNQVQGIDFATVHSYPDLWLKGQDEEAQLTFLHRWVDTHIKDAGTTLKKPVLFAEFGKTSRDPGYNVAHRDGLFRIIYEAIVKSEPAGGALFWQLFAIGMAGDPLADGYEVLLYGYTTTTTLIHMQSRRIRNLPY